MIELLVFCDYFCNSCKIHYSFIQEILEDSILEKLKSTKQKCPCGYIIEGIFTILVPPLWKFAISGDESNQILKFNNSECIVLSHLSIRIELSDLIRSGFSGRIDIFDNGTLLESIKVRNLFQDYMVNKYKKKRGISLPNVHSSSEIRIEPAHGWVLPNPTRQEEAIEDEEAPQEEEER